MTTWTSTNKSSTPTWTAVTKSSTSWTAATKPTPKAQAGQYYGFGAFTYSGGQTLSGANGTTWTAVTKS